MNEAHRTDPRPGVDIRWLGQAGFTVQGFTATVVLDPYLSDYCRTVFGLERMVPAPVTPAQIRADLVLVSHWHEDHLDLDSAAEFAVGGAIFVAPPSCVARLQGRGIPATSIRSIRSGESLALAGVAVTAVPAVHQVPGFLTEDAVGYLLEIDGVRVYHSGDTEYHRSLLTAAERGHIDAALLCVNGTGGNMNSLEAAALATQLEPGLTIPMHFGMWAAEAYGPGATLDPQEFLRTYQRLRPEAPTLIPTLGQAHTVRSRT